MSEFGFGKMAVLPVLKVIHPKLPDPSPTVLPPQIELTPKSFVVKVRLDGAPEEPIACLFVITNPKWDVASL